MSTRKSKSTGARAINNDLDLDYSKYDSIKAIRDKATLGGEPFLFFSITIKRFVTDHLDSFEVTPRNLENPGYKNLLDTFTAEHGAEIWSMDRDDYNPGTGLLWPADKGVIECLCFAMMRLEAPKALSAKKRRNRSPAAAEDESTVGSATARPRKKARTTNLLSGYMTTRSKKARGTATTSGVTQSPSGYTENSANTIDTLVGSASVTVSKKVLSQPNYESEEDMDGAAVEVDAFNGSTVEPAQSAEKGQDAKEAEFGMKKIGAGSSDVQTVVEKRVTRSAAAKQLSSAKPQTSTPTGGSDNQTVVEKRVTRSAAAKQRSSAKSQTSISTTRAKPTSLAKLKTHPTASSLEHDVKVTGTRPRRSASEATTVRSDSPSRLAVERVQVSDHGDQAKAGTDDARTLPFLPVATASVATGTDNRMKSDHVPAASHYLDQSFSVIKHASSAEAPSEYISPYAPSRHPLQGPPKLTAGQKADLKADQMIKDAYAGNGLAPHGNLNNIMGPGPRYMSSQRFPTTVRSGVVFQVSIRTPSKPAVLGDHHIPLDPACLFSAAYGAIYLAIRTSEARVALAEATSLDVSANGNGLRSFPMNLPLVELERIWGATMVEVRALHGKGERLFKMIFRA